MAEQPRPNPLEPSNFFDDQSSARPLPEGTIPRTDPPARAIAADMSDGYTFDRSLLATNGFPASFPTHGPELSQRLERGRQRFNIYCSVCHGETGAGDGMVVQRGFVQPPAYYPLAEHAKTRPDLFAREQVLANTPPSHIYEVITNGYGAMYSYAARVQPEDRWNIAAYIKALQLSRNGIKPADLPEEDRKMMETQPQ